MDQKKFPKLNIDTILWDNDGVLVHTEPQYLQASREMLADVGVQLTEDQFRDISLKRGESLMQLAPQEDIHALRIRRDNRYAELISARVQVREGVEDCLRQFHGKLKMGIVTSSQKIHFDIIHEKTGFLKYFDFVITRERYQHSKPHPDAYLLAIETQKIEKAKAVVIEDTERGVEAAMAAGLQCIAVPHELSEQGNFENATAVISNFSELKKIIQV